MSIYPEFLRQRESRPMDAEDQVMTSRPETPAADAEIPVAAGWSSCCAPGRDVNGDCVAVDPQSRFFLIADGAGSCGSGALASCLVTELLCPLLACMHRRISEDRAVGVDGLLRELLCAAHDVLRRYQQADRCCDAMAASLVFGLLCRSRLHLAAVGDCSAVLSHAGSVQVLAHSGGRRNRLPPGLRRGAAIRADGRGRFVIDRLGAPGARGTGEIASVPVHPGDRLVLATDGVGRYVAPAEVAAVADHFRDADEAAKHLTDAAFRRGCSDDASCVVVVFDADAPPPPPRVLRWALPDGRRCLSTTTWVRRMIRRSTGVF